MNKQVKEKDIKQFNKEFEKLQKTQTKSIYLEIKRNWNLKKKIKYKNSIDNKLKIMKKLKLPNNLVKNQFIFIDNKLSKITIYKDNEVEFLQVYKEFWLKTKFKFNSKKIIFENHFFHLFALTNDSLKSLFIKKVLKKNFKNRSKELQNLLKKN